MIKGQLWRFEAAAQGTRCVLEATLSMISAGARAKIYRQRIMSGGRETVGVQFAPRARYAGEALLELTGSATDPQTGASALRHK